MIFLIAVTLDNIMVFLIAVTFNNIVIFLIVVILNNNDGINILRFNGYKQFF